jgi:hypothetical protein
MRPPRSKSRGSTSSQFERVFAGLRAILGKHAGRFTVTSDRPNRYCLEAPVGPATLQLWRGKLKSRTIPVAWVEVGKSYVSFHLMPVYANAQLSKEIPKALKARMQGKSCFNFTTLDDVPFDELDRLTTRGLAAFVEAGFVTPP